MFVKDTVSSGVLLVVVRQVLRTIAHDRDVMLVLGLRSGIPNTIKQSLMDPEYLVHRYNIYIFQASPRIASVYQIS